MILYVDGSPYSASMAYTPARLNKHYYIHRDRQGSVRYISDTLGNIVATYNYDPWGRQTNEQGEAYKPYEEPLLLLGRGYTGHEHLPWFNLINMNARLYDPVLGRFLSPDPYVVNAGYLQDYNRYSYARNNPLLYTDPTGEIVWLPIIIGAVIGTYMGGTIANGGEYNPVKRDYNSGKTWGYMLGGAVVGGLAGWAGGVIATSGIPMANTVAIGASSLINSVGTHIYTGGQTPISMSLGVASYDFTNGTFGYLGKKGNKWYENVGYGLGALANVSDIINLPFWSGKKETINPDGTITKEPQKVGLTTNNEDWISHSAVDIDGSNAISWEPTETSYSNFEYLTNFNRGTNSYPSYYGEVNKTLPHLPVRANANIVNAYSKFLSSSKLPYNAIMSSCSTHASIGLNLAGAFNLGFIHPYLLHYNLMINTYLYF